MNIKSFDLNFDANDFAKSFGVDASEFSDSLQNTINDLNFNYRLPSLEENESLVLEALQKIDSD